MIMGMAQIVVAMNEQNFQVFGDWDAIKSVSFIKKLLIIAADHCREMNIDRLEYERLCARVWEISKNVTKEEGGIEGNGQTKFFSEN